MSSFFKIFMDLFSTFVNIMGALILIYWLIRLGSGSSWPVPNYTDNNPATQSPRPPSRWARCTEAFALALLGGVVLFICVTSTHSGGYLFQLDELRPEARLEYLGVMALAALAVAAAVALTLRTGRTVMAILFLIVTLGCYGAYLNAGDAAGWLKNRPGANQAEQDKPDTLVEIRLTRNIAGFDFSFEGAELWVNGVHLGKTPVRLPVSRIRSLVPRWSAPPATLKDQPLQTTETTPWSVDHATHYRWFRLTLPRRPIDEKSEKELRHLDDYAQAKLGNEPGFQLPRSRGRGDNVHYTIELSATFPQAEARLARLLAQARLKDFAVGEAWIKELNRFGEPAWELLDHLAQREPGFDQIRRQRIARLFGLSYLNSPAQNWDFFESVMKQADRTGFYDTETTVGQAVAIVAPLLDPDRLADLAEGLIPCGDRIAAAYDDVRGRLEFGSLQTTWHGSQQWFNSGRFRTGVYDGGARPYPTRSLVIAHAVWIAQQALKDQDPARLTVFEDRVAPQLLRWLYDNDVALRLAAKLGGLEVNRFLARHDWRTPYASGKGDWADMMRVGADTEVKKWFYLLTIREDAYGQAFRRDNADLVMVLADLLTRKGDLNMEPGLLDFLFLDNPLGPQSSLGYQYWPRYRLRAQAENGAIFKKELRYLVRLAPLATKEMYAQAWRDAWENDKSWSQAGVDDFRNELKALTPPQRTTALRAFAAEIKRELAAPADLSRNAREDQRDLGRALTELQRQLLEDGDMDSMLSLLAELTSPGAAARREQVAAWLAQSRPDHPLVELLARWKSPDLRKMAVAPIVKLPTRERRALLERLLADSDAGVRQAAREAQAELKRLSGM